MNSDKQKKVAMILSVDFLRPYVHPRLYKEARSLVNGGYDVSVICWSKWKDDLPESEQYEEVYVLRVFQAVPHHTVHLVWRLPAYALFVLKSVKKILKLKPDIIHCNDLDTLAIGVLVRIIARKPLIFDAYEEFPAMYRSSGGPVWLARLYYCQGG